MKTFTAAEVVEIWNKIRERDSCDESAVVPFFTVFEYHSGGYAGASDSGRKFYEQEVEYLKKHFPEFLNP